MLHSVAGQLKAGGLIQKSFVKVGVHLFANRGCVLFLDELAAFFKPVLDALQQPLETGQVVVDRLTYPGDQHVVAI